MAKNEVTLLKSENNNHLRKLEEEDKWIIRDIMKSMSIFKVNSYDAQVIRRDLIGMAEELKLRDSSLKDTIGDDLKGFTNKIIDSSDGPCKREIMLNFLSKLFGYFFTWFILAATLQYGRLSWEASPIVSIFYVGVVIIIFITDGILAPIFSTEKGIKKNLQSLIARVIVVIWAIINYRLVEDGAYTKIINGGLIIIISGVGFLVIRYLIKKNIHRLAREKKNHIDDLI